MNDPTEDFSPSPTPTTPPPSKPSRSKRVLFSTFLAGFLLILGGLGVGAYLYLNSPENQIKRAIAASLSDANNLDVDVSLSQLSQNNWNATMNFKISNYEETTHMALSFLELNYPILRGLADGYNGIEVITNAKQHLLKVQGNVDSLNYFGLKLIADLTAINDNEIGTLLETHWVDITEPFNQLLGGEDGNTEDNWELVAATKKCVTEHVVDKINYRRIDFFDIVKELESETIRGVKSSGYEIVLNKDGVSQFWSELYSALTDNDQLRSCLNEVAPNHDVNEQLDSGEIEKWEDLDEVPDEPFQVYIGDGKITRILFPQQSSNDIEIGFDFLWEAKQEAITFPEKIIHLEELQEMIEQAMRQDPCGTPITSTNKKDSQVAPTQVDEATAKDSSLCTYIIPELQELEN